MANSILVPPRIGFSKKHRNGVNDQEYHDQPDAVFRYKTHQNGRHADENLIPVYSNSVADEKILENYIVVVTDFKLDWSSLDLPSHAPRLADAVICGIGTAAPKAGICQADGIRLAQRLSSETPRQAKKVAAVYRRSGIQQRGSVLVNGVSDSISVTGFYPSSGVPEDRGPSTKSRSERYATEAPPLATIASGRAMDDALVHPDQITHLVTVSCTGFSAPGIDIELIDRLGLPATTERVHIGFMGCHGVINALRVSQGLAVANPGANILLCSIELCSLHYQYGYDADRIVSGALFADGSAAMVLRSSSGDERGLDRHRAVTLPAVVAATGSCLVSNSRDAMTWKIGDHGFEMTLSSRVPSLIESQLPGFLSKWLAGQGESIESVGGWAVHPGGTRILQAVESSLGLPNDALQTSRQVLTDHGNMSSATMAFIVERFIDAAVPKPWLMLGFGPGLEIEVALIR